MLSSRGFCDGAIPRPTEYSKFERYGARGVSRKVAGSITCGVIEIFHCYNPSGRTMALGLTQLLNINENQEYFLEGKDGRCVGLTTLPPVEIWEPQTPGILRACPGIALPLSECDCEA
jgi:hypothetical protein